MDLKTSLLVNKQLPEFVREDYPLFVSFLEAYYEFLETERYTNVDGEIVSQKNNLTEKLKQLKNISDIDYSLDDFEQQFFNTFIPYLPQDTAVSKDFLIKNILPLYKSKGTQKSFQYLFRLLFGEEIQVEYPGDKVLRASDGKWTIENTLRTEVEIYSEYISNGIKTTYDLPYEIDGSEIQITINGVTTQNYYIRKELKKIYFNSAPASNSVIKVFYTGTFNTSIFQSRRILGKTSGATAIIEKIAKRNIGGSNFYQFFINEKNTIGVFKNGEIIEITDVNSIPFYLQTLSNVQSLQIVNPGTNYVVGDQVIFRGAATERALAIVDQISLGNVETLSVRLGNFGAGYKVNNNVYANGVSSNIFSAIIDVVDDSGTISPNTFSYNTDTISPYLSVVISDPYYGFPVGNIANGNVNTVISEVLSQNTITNLGPATSVNVLTTSLSSNSNAVFLANSTLLFGTTRISDFNSIGTIRVTASGTGYSVGDQIIFTNTQYFSGQGASAFVSSVNPSGGITGVTVQNGGYNYNKQYLPTLSVDSPGTGASLVVEHFMGQDVEFDYTAGDGIQGKILSIKLIDSGKGYTVTPTVDLTLSGDGNAIVLANIPESLVKLPGRWITDDGLLSTDEIRLQGENYYIDFSYVITSKVEFQRYKNIIKDLLNPVGSINYAKYQILDNVASTLQFSVDDEFTRQLAGQVNVSANSIYVHGNQNVYFELANFIGVLTEGKYILVNSEIRIVNSIINNTDITVSESFNYNASDQFVTILSVPYNAVTTEYWRELAISIDGPRSIVITTEENF